jgi:hypothetical protein
MAEIIIMGLNNAGTVLPITATKREIVGAMLAGSRCDNCGDGHDVVELYHYAAMPYTLTNCRQGTRGTICRECYNIKDMEGGN